MAVEKLHELGASVTYDYQLIDDAYIKSSRPLPPKPPGPAWLRSLLGVDFFSNVIGVDVPRGSRLQREETGPLLSRFPRLKYLSIRCQGCDDSWLNALDSFAELETLCVDGDFTDRGLRHLGKLKQLRALVFRGSSRVTERGIAQLSGLTKLQSLDLADTTIDGSWVDCLRQMESLSSVRVSSKNRGVATIEFNRAPRQSNR